MHFFLYQTRKKIYNKLKQMNKLILCDIIMKNIHNKLNLIHRLFAVMECTFFVVISLSHNSLCQTITRSDCVLRCVTPTMGRAVSYNPLITKLQKCS
jgi:hypothetical protein